MPAPRDVGNLVVAGNYGDEDSGDCTEAGRAFRYDPRDLPRHGRSIAIGAGGRL